jgi:hypothetical protein
VLDNTRSQSAVRGSALHRADVRPSRVSDVMHTERIGYAAPFIRRDSARKADAMPAPRVSGRTKSRRRIGFLDAPLGWGFSIALTGVREHDGSA